MAAMVAAKLKRCELPNTGPAFLVALNAVSPVAL